MSPSEETHNPPESDFSDGFAKRVQNAPADERVYRVALGLTEPTRVSTVATRADCSKNAARRHLRRLEEIGVITRVTEDPETFSRNESYFEWRRMNRLSELSDDAYTERLGALLTENTAYKTRYGVEEPSAIDPLEYDTYGDPEEVYLDLNNWAGIRREIRDLRQSRQGSAVDEGVV